MGLLDTGSTVSVVHPSVLSRLSQNSEICLNSEGGRLRLADGSATESLGTVQLDLQLGTGKDIWPHMMVVTEIEAPIVIGIDFLRKHQCALSIKTESLTVWDTTHLCWSVKDMPQVFRINVAETVVIPAMSEMTRHLLCPTSPKALLKVLTDLCAMIMWLLVVLCWIQLEIFSLWDWWISVMSPKHCTRALGLRSATQLCMWVR